MKNVNLTIDERPVEVPAGTSILEAARKADIYIPSLCYPPDLPPAKEYTAARESELIQKYVLEHGRMPGGAGDDLF